MARIDVGFRAHYDEYGLTDDEPTDLLTNVADVIETFDFIEVEGIPDNADGDIEVGEGWCTKIWRYEVADEDKTFFESRLDDCPTVQWYRDVTTK